MFVHAHPDDESSQSPATMSRYVDEGAQVTLVTCTLGELGEILVPELEHLSPKELGAHRIGELTRAMETLGVTDHVWLGGQGHYHDSGMATDEQGNVIPRDELPEGAFWAADLLEAADHLVALIRDRRPQVIATYDQNGNYGHPDHIQAHREAMRRRFNIDPEQIAAVIGFDERAERCEAALAAYRSQVDPESPFWKLARLTRSIDGSGEAYRLAAGVPFPGDGPADDLFAGLDV